MRYFATFVSVSVLLFCLMATSMWTFDILTKAEEPARVFAFTQAMFTIVFAAVATTALFGIWGKRDSHK